MIEEIDSATYTQHFFEKVYQEVGSDPKAFLGAALDYVAKQTSFFKQPGAAEQVAELAHRHATGGATAAPPPPPAAAPPPAATPAAAQAPASAEPAQPEAAQLAAAAAAQAPAAPAEPAQEEDEEEGKGSGLKPNAGNGADLPGYSWTQTLVEAVVSVPVPPGTKGRACDVAITRDRLRVGLKWQPPVLDGPLFAAVRPDDCLWNLVDGRVVEVTLAKLDGMAWWRCVVQGQPEINVQQVEPEASKLTDLDPELRSTVEKMMYDQRQKAMGLPTSEEQQKMDMIERFKAQHPELDFTNAKIEL